MSRKILLDMDGVIADFVAGAGKVWRFDPALVVTWDFFHEFDINPVDFWYPLGREFWAGLPKTPEADAVVSACEDAVGAENVCLLSSPCATEGCMEGKLDWIRRHYPQFSRRFLFGPAKQFCAGGSNLLIDDSDANCTAFYDAGGMVIMFPRPWNAARGKDPMAWLKERL